MIYICYKAQSGRWLQFDIKEIATENEALKFIEDKHLPQTRIVGVFEGKRLDFTIGEKRVIKKSVIGFKDFVKEKIEGER